MKSESGACVRRRCDEAACVPNVAGQNLASDVAIVPGQFVGVGVRIQAVAHAGEHDGVALATPDRGPRRSPGPGRGSRGLCCGSAKPPTMLRVKSRLPRSRGPVVVTTDTSASEPATRPSAGSCSRVHVAVGAEHADQPARRDVAGRLAGRLAACPACWRRRPARRIPDRKRSAASGREVRRPPRGRGRSWSARCRTTGRARRRSDSCRRDGRRRSPCGRRPNRRRR